MPDQTRGNLDLDSALLPERCLELARNTPAAVAAYPSLLIFCSLASPIGREHSIVMGMLIFASLLAGLVRLSLARKLLKEPAAASLGWLFHYRLSAMAVGGVWGLFAALAVHLYGSQWASQLAQVVTVGLTAGASSSLVSDIRLLRLYVVMMIVPSWPFLLALRDEQSWAAPVLMIFLLFILATARNSSGRYLAGLRAQLLLKQRTSELEAASRAKSEFLAVMSHEIRTPMNAVFGLTELLLGSKLDVQQLEWAQTVRNSCESLLDLISGILDLSKIESGQFELEALPYDLRDCLDSMVALFTPVADQRSLALHTDLGAVPKGTWLRGDRTRVRQVLANLLSNALKFTAEGSVRLTARKFALAQQDWVEVVVCDSGLGIPADKMDRLFRPFNQVDASTTRRFGGTGLGLAVCRNLSELMGGLVWVVSSGAIAGDSPDGFVAEGPANKAGATFYFRFPTVSAPAPPALKPPAPSETAPMPEKAMRILLAEDNFVNQGLFQTMLERLGYRVELACNGLEVLKACAQQRFEVIFMDLQMPEMDGLDTTRRLRTDGVDSWIIALTANAFQEDRERCLAVGMNDYLSKPILMADFVRVLKAYAARAPETLYAAAVS